MFEGSRLLACFDQARSLAKKHIWTTKESALASSSLASETDSYFN